MMYGRVVLCLILLACGFTALADEVPVADTPTSATASSHAVATPALSSQSVSSQAASLETVFWTETVCSGVDFETATHVEIAEWAKSVGGTVDFGPSALGGTPDCPTVVPFCVGLIPITCPPRPCRKGQICSSQDQGYSSCNLPGGGLFQCSLGETVHKKICICDNTCAEAMCALTTSELVCE